jgi:hypothetical protein
VLRRRAEGVLVRQIAVQVFLHRDATAEPAGEAPEPLAIDGLSELEVFKLLFQRRLAAIAAAGGVPSMNERGTCSNAAAARGVGAG